MKFSNGCWLQQEGCECFTPQQVYFSKIEENRVTLFAPTNRINHRGDTLGGINLTLVITSPIPEVLRVQTYHHLGAVKKSPAFEINETCLPLTTFEDDEHITIASGSLTLEIGKKNWYMKYTRNGKVITESKNRDLALMKTDWKGLAYDKGDNSDTYIRQQLSIGVGELVYGLGERFTPFVKNGQSVDIWNADGGTSTEQSYKNIPFYLTNKGYGVFVNHPEKVSFEVGTEMVTKTEFSVEGTYLDYFLINGPSMKEVLTRYTDLTGKPSLPAPWTFGLWLSTSFTTNYDEETVMSFVNGMLDRGIPLRTFHFDCFWMKEFHWSDFLWDSRVFPDPVGMLKRIKEKGLNICVWINSYIGQESILFKEGMEKGYFIKRPNGEVWQWDMWQPGMAIVDFTNPAAWKWFQDKLEILLDVGVDCFKTDFGERIPTNCVYYDGSDPEKMHNYYTYLYNKAVFNLLKEVKGENEAVLFARSATAGGQQFPVHWGGDCFANYPSMAETLRGGLSFAMSGFSFWSHDISGFESTATPDLYKRWAAFGLLSTHSRLHGSASYRVPWLFDEEACDVVAFFTKLKCRLMPYLYAKAIEAHMEGTPVMRPMVFEFTGDPAVNYLDTQYMLGEALLVSPIFREDGVSEYYLPQGKWTHLLSGEVREGGRWQKDTYDYFSMPLYVRENTLLPVGCEDMRPDYDYEKGLSLHLYQPVDGAVATCQIPSTDGSIVNTITAEKTAGAVTIHLEKELGEVAITVHIGNEKVKQVIPAGVKEFSVVS